MIIMFKFVTGAGAVDIRSRSRAKHPGTELWLSRLWGAPQNQPNMTGKERKNPKRNFNRKKHRRNGRYGRNARSGIEMTAEGTEELYTDQTQAEYKKHPAKHRDQRERWVGCYGRLTRRARV